MGRARVLAVLAGSGGRLWAQRVGGPSGPIPYLRRAWPERVGRQRELMFLPGATRGSSMCVGGAGQTPLTRCDTDREEWVNKKRRCTEELGAIEKTRIQEDVNQT